MLKLSIILITIFYAYGEINNRFENGRIVGGQLADIKSIPWQVSVEVFRFHICGGSIITSTHILTAAHCTDNHKRKPNVLSIRAGTKRKHFNGSKIGIIKIFQHPSYNDKTMDSDISILLLRRNLRFSLNIQAINLPHQNEYVSIGENAIVSGWGRIGESEGSSSYLLSTTVPIISNHQCNQLYRSVNEITPNMICAVSNSGGKDACQGDSGGPLVLNNTIIGIVSWGYGCGRQNVPGVYTRVARYRKWIDRILNTTI